MFFTFTFELFVRLISDEINILLRSKLLTNNFINKILFVILILKSVK
jgi:hypothetical protein